MFKGGGFIDSSAHEGVCCQFLVDPSNKLLCLGCCMLESWDVCCNLSLLDLLSFCEVEGVSFHLRCGSTKRESADGDRSLDLGRASDESDRDDEDGDASHRINPFFPESFIMHDGA